MARKKKSETVEAPANSLINALEWVNVAQKDDGNIYQTHCLINAGTLTAFNGITAAGHTISDQLTACPHTKRLLDALNRCKAGYQLSQAASDRLAITGGAFSALVACVDWREMTPIAPDMPVVGIDDRIKAGFSVVSPLARDNAETVIASSILLQSNLMAATDRHAIVQFWHGFSGIPDLVLPKTIATAILKIDKQLTSIGFSQSTATFWFGNDAWLKTQLFNEEWPDLNPILEPSEYYQNIPPTFVEGLEAVAPFVKNDTVHLGQNIITTANETGIQVASFNVPLMQADVKISLHHLLSISKHIRQIDFTPRRNALHFLGDNTRGAIVVKV